MRKPDDDFTPIELEFLKSAWMLDLETRGWNLNAEARKFLLGRICELP